MAAPLLQKFATLVSNQVAATQVAASALVSFTRGAILRANINANAAIGIWLQGLALQAMALSRFASSFGSDADSWGGDWGFFRNGATNAQGFVTFSRFTPTTGTTIPVGGLVQTIDKTQQFAVVADATNAAWNGSNGYTVLGGTASVTVKVKSVTAAAAANVIAGAISSMVTAISGIDFVSNALPMTGGADAESDASFKARFPAYLQSLARGTVAAITGAVQATQQNMQVQILESVTFAGASQPGFLTVIADDGSGAPPAGTLTAASVAVNNYRAAGIQYGLFGPSILTVNVSYALATLPGYDHPTLITMSQNAVLAFIDGLLDGASLSWSQIYQVIYNSSPGISDVTGLLINGATADIVPPHVYTVIKAGTVVGS